MLCRHNKLLFWLFNSAYILHSTFYNRTVFIIYIFRAGYYYNYNTWFFKPNLQSVCWYTCSYNDILGLLQLPWAGDINKLLKSGRKLFYFFAKIHCCRFWHFSRKQYVLEGLVISFHLEEVYKQVMHDGSRLFNPFMWYFLNYMLCRHSRSIFTSIIAMTLISLP